MPLVRMAGPSMCPGHYDTRPSEIKALSRCGLLLRFDFQQGLDRPLADRGEKSCQVAAVTAVGGLCMPDTYVSVCRQVADCLVRAGFGPVRGRTPAGKLLNAWHRSGGM